MKIGAVLLMMVSSVLLPTADVFSDMFLTLKLFTGLSLDINQSGSIRFKFEIRHPLYGAFTLVPLIMSWIGTTIYWFQTERKEKRNRWKTFPLLLLQVYPQWRALRVTYYGKIKKDQKDLKWKKMKEEFEGGIKHLGKHFK